MYQEMDHTVITLLSKTADTNQFIRDDAMKTLEAMIDSVPPQKAIAVLVTNGTKYDYGFSLLDQAGYLSLFAYVQNEKLRTKVLIFCIRVIHHAVRTRVHFYAQSYSIYSNRHCYLAVPFSLTAMSCLIHLHSHLKFHM